MLRNAYRAAKRFKLDEDYEVVDKFSGSSRNPIKSDYKDYPSHYRIYQLYCNPLHRLINQSEGMEWNKVYSYIKRKISRRSDYQRYAMLNMLEWRIPGETVIRNGVFQFKKQKWARGGNVDVPAPGELYIDTDGVTRKVPKEPKYKGPKRPNYYRMSVSERAIHDAEVLRTRRKFEFNKDIWFKELKNSYNRRIGKGPTFEVAEYNWFKIISQDRVRFTTRYVKNRDTGVYESLIEPVNYQQIVVSSASKKDIKQFKLNEVR